VVELALGTLILTLLSFPQLFKGKFYHCLGVDTRNITNRSDCVAANYRWVHHKYNFDNLGQVSAAHLPWSDLSPCGNSSSLLMALGSHT
jgi:hypothetical protein